MRVWLIILGLPRTSLSNERAKQLPVRILRSKCEFGTRSARVVDAQTVVRA